ncbi:MAG TPA: hypothetical protein VFO95_10130 [Gemmatimonadales bacterium]|nr:hypothetical protein [Gemmatimonadales bacterium]
MRWTLALAAVGLAATPLSAQNPDPDRQVAGTGSVPSGWSVRADRNRPLTSLKFEIMGNGFHFTTGPAVIAWRDADATTGAFHAVANFTQTKAPAHAEAYGMFIAGKNMKDSTVSYTYFIIRGDGKYLVKQMSGATATNVTQGWTEHPAVVKQDSAGKQTNKIEVSADKDGKVSWKVNGQEVHSMTLTPAVLNGVVGLRVYHNLDVLVDGFAVHQL